MFNRLMALNHEAFEGRRFDVAYHTLAAALHAAELERDTCKSVSELSQVETTATTQAAWISEHAPEYHHPPASVQKPTPSSGSTDTYSALARQARGKLP